MPQILSFQNLALATFQVFSYCIWPVAATLSRAVAELILSSCIQQIPGNVLLTSRLIFYPEETENE